jgi:hypothetical protein
MRLLERGGVRRLVHHLDAGPISLDPAHSLDYAAQFILAAVLEPLFVQAAPGRFELGAATSWRVSDDGLVHQFVLRRDGRWCDGSPVVADDFVTAFGRILDPARANASAGILSPLSEAESIAPDVLQVVLRNPIDDLPARLAAAATSPVPASAGTCDWHPGPCNGPLCVERLSDARIDLRPNPFARPGLRAEAALSIRIDRELHRPLANFEAGEVDITCSTWFPFDELSRYSHRPELRIGGSPIRFLICGNEEKVPDWGRLETRTELSACVDRDAIAGSLSGGVIPWPENAFIDRAASVATSSRPAPGSRSAVLMVPDFYPNLIVAKAVTDSWRAAGLIDSEIEALDFPVFADRWARTDYDLCLALVVPPYPSTDALAPALAGFAPRDARAEALELSAAATEGATGAAQADARVALEAFYERAMPFIPLLAGRSIWLQRSCVHGYAVFPDGGHAFRGFRAEPKAIVP